MSQENQSLESRRHGRTFAARPGSVNPSPLPPVRIPIDAPVEARLLRRYKRFLADVELEDGRVLTVHCPNPGRMLGTQAPGSPVRCSVHDDPRRKLGHTLEMIRVGRIWVGLHAARANDVARRVLEAGTAPALRGYSRIEHEVLSPEGSRFDFRLSRSALENRGGADGPASSRVCWIEVKSVTLCAGRRARFPDAVTLRGRRHLEHLAARVAAGERAVLLFVAQRGDADSVAPADDIDPDYGRALRAAAAAGVELHALGARVSPTGITVARRLPVLL